MNITLVNIFEFTYDFNLKDRECFISNFASFIYLKRNLLLLGIIVKYLISILSKETSYMQIFHFKSDGS